MVEEWRDIKGFEGCYQVSNLGRVKSLERERRLGHSIKIVPERFLRPGKSKGYMRVVLVDRDIKRNVFVHRLVAEAFLTNPDNLPQVNHKDENRENNSVSNLEWVTAKENINYGYGAIKRHEGQRYKQPHMKKVFQYDMSGNLIREYISIRDAARECRIDRSGISHCCNGKKDFKTYKGYVWRYEEVTA